MRTATPRATLALAAVTGISFALANAVSVGRIELLAGFIPGRVFGTDVPGALPLWLTPLSATLLHASVLHLGFNLFMLLFCGREVEVALGSGGTAALYGVGAYAAAAAQFMVFPHSPVPMIGASGAVSALVGAYALLYGQRRASRHGPELARWLHVTWLAAAWIGIQLLVGIASLRSGVAVAAAAHVGGFLAGLLLARPLLRWRFRKA